LQQIAADRGPAYRIWQIAGPLSRANAGGFSRPPDTIVGRIREWRLEG